MARKKREDELAALRAENARLKAMLDQQEAAQQERLPQPAPAQAEMALSAPEHPKRPRQPRKSKTDLGVWAYGVLVLGLLLDIPATFLLLSLGASLGISTQWEGWRWVFAFLYLLPMVAFTVLKVKADLRKNRERSQRAQQREHARLIHTQQKALERLARAQQKEDARVARLQERERAKAAKATAPKKTRERPRITRPLRAPTTQKLEPME